MRFCAYQLLRMDGSVGHDLENLSCITAAKMIAWQHSFLHNAAGSQLWSAASTLELTVNFFDFSPEAPALSDSETAA